MFGTNKYDGIAYTKIVTSKRGVVSSRSSIEKMVAVAEMSYVTWSKTVRFLVEENIDQIKFINNSINEIEKSSRPELAYHGILYTTPELYETVSNKIKKVL